MTMDDGDDVRKWNDAESHAGDLFTARTNKHIYGRICVEEPNTSLTMVAAAAAAMTTTKD